LLLQSLLGIWADAPGATLRVDQPHLPQWLTSLDIRDIRVGGARVSLSFRRTSTGHTGFSLLEQEGDVRVTMSASTG
jgi:hypothetical protein